MGLGSKWLAESNIQTHASTHLHQRAAPSALAAQHIAGGGSSKSAPRAYRARARAPLRERRPPPATPSPRRGALSCDPWPSSQPHARMQSLPALHKTPLQPPITHRGRTASGGALLHLEAVQCRQQNPRQELLALNGAAGACAARLQRQYGTPTNRPRGLGHQSRPRKRRVVPRALIDLASSTQHSVCCCCVVSVLCVVASAVGA